MMGSRDLLLELWDPFYIISRQSRNTCRWWFSITIFSSVLGEQIQTHVTCISEQRGPNFIKFGRDT